MAEQAQVMTELARTLGLIGALAMVGSAVVAVYLVALRWRATTWFDDVARFSSILAACRGRPRFRHRPIPWNLWPVMGPDLPRTWRWPLNSTRWFCAGLWHLIAHRRGLVALIARAAWFPAAGIGAAAALAWATLATLTIAVPIVTLRWLIDTTTVLRGGTPPSKGSRTSPTSPPPTDGDWDRALAELVANQPSGSSGVEHGIRIGGDGRALDPADQHALDQRRHHDQAQAADRRLDRIERILDREERLAGRADPNDRQP